VVLRAGRVAERLQLPRAADVVDKGPGASAAAAVGTSASPEHLPSKLTLGQRDLHPTKKHQKNTTTTRMRKKKEESKEKGTEEETTILNK
jgi:hypothetical protein